MARRNLRIPFLTLAALVGCNGTKSESPAPTAVESKAAVTSDTPTPAVASFADAVTETGSEEQQPPPDRTLSGLATGKLRLDVQRMWSGIAFTLPSGKPLAYTATVDTELGQVVIALRPEIAPNHVRNFVALARAGYYNGLLFENVVSENTEGGGRLEWVEGGCPLGTGETGL